MVAHVPVLIHILPLQEGSHKVFDDIAGNFGRAYHFYTDGVNVDTRKGKNKLKISCTNNGLKDCRDDVPAYTAQPVASPDNQWTMVICPTFWTKDKKFINAWGKENPGVQQLPKLLTYEGLLLHEMFHCDLPRFPAHITDMNVDDSTWKVAPVNGANLCEDFAWKYGRSRPKKINQETAWNADNYAWYLVSRWFNKRLGWDVGHDELMVVNGNTTTGGAPFDFNGTSTSPVLDLGNETVHVHRAALRKARCFWCAKDELD
jgi:hypothetical protein